MAPSHSTIHPHPARRCLRRNHRTNSTRATQQQSSSCTSMGSCPQQRCNCCCRSRCCLGFCLARCHRRYRYIVNGCGGSRVATMSARCSHMSSEWCRSVPMSTQNLASQRSSCTPSKCIGCQVDMVDGRDLRRSRRRRLASGGGQPKISCRLQRYENVIELEDVVHAFAWYATPSVVDKVKPRSNNQRFLVHMLPFIIDVL